MKEAKKFGLSLEEYQSQGKYIEKANKDEKTHYPKQTGVGKEEEDSAAGLGAFKNDENEKDKMSECMMHIESGVPLSEGRRQKEEQAYALARQQSQHGDSGQTGYEVIEGSEVKPHEEEYTSLPSSDSNYYQQHSLDPNQYPPASRHDQYPHHSDHYPLNHSSDPHPILSSLNLLESDDDPETNFTKESLHKLQKEKPQSLQDAINQQPHSFEGIIAIHQQMHSDITWYSTNFDHVTQRCKELFDNLEERRSSFRQKASQLQEVYKQNIDRMKKMNENLTSRLRSLQDSHNSLIKEHQELQRSHDTLTANHQKLLKSHDTITVNHQRLRNSHTSLRKEHQELQESNATLTISHEELQTSHDNLRITHQQEVTRHQKSQEENENRLQEVNQRLVQAQIELAAKQNEVTKLQNTLQKLEDNWKVSHTEVSLSKKELGRGGWGVIWIGEFRGQRVAVKQMHELIKSDEYMELLHREINTMSQLRHPNLLQFIGAVLDHPSGNPMIITEVMDTSLRSTYERKELTTDPGCRPVILSIMRDVAVGLNYLHCLPDPIIHRDVSSANVLLESKGHNKWKTKISDFGSAKFARAAVTAAPGAAVYSAPATLATIHRKKR
ncbi:PREDICTED: dual specificity protein kinase shkE-like, partial [Amphimedon queenslandica]